MKKLSLSSTRLGQSIMLLQPTRPFFCSSRDQNGGDHIAPFAWLTPISSNPPRVALALQNEKGRKRSATLDNIIRTNEFIINMPVAGQEKELIRSSFMPDEGCPCKFDRTGYTRQQGQRVNVAAIAECPANLECVAFNVIDHGGDHTVIFADIIAAQYAADCYDEGLCPCIPAMLPLINLKERRFDDHQEHIFLDSVSVRRIRVFYDKSQRSQECSQPLEQGSEQ